MPRRQDQVVDALVGRNVRSFRKQRDLSQREFAKRLGVSFQQLQKYENGSNRIGSGCLFKMSTILKVPIIVLFAGVGRTTNQKVSQSLELPLDDRYTLRLLHAFREVKNPVLRRTITHMVENISDIKGATTTRKPR
jgi:transcriptional regulator with XRE-family HTH domain